MSDNSREEELASLPKHDLIVRLISAEELLDFFRKKAENLEGKLAALQEECLVLHQDNYELAKRSGVPYRIGMTMEDTERIQSIEKKIRAEYESLLHSKEESIRYFQSLLEGSPRTGEKRKRGRKTILNDEVRQRVRSLYSSGLSMRSVAEMENISLGSVSNILKGTENDGRIIPQ